MSGDSRRLCPLLLTLLQPRATDWFAQDGEVSRDAGFGVLKLGKFWANRDEFVYSVSATLASFLFP